jgi:hypothetical protein
MKEIKSTTVEVKLSDGHEDKYVLVHDGERIIELASPKSGKLGTHPRNKMLAGTKREIEAEIKRLKLKPKRPRRPVEHWPPVEKARHMAGGGGNDSGKSKNNL